ncbi:MAG TPA: hypothetical protein DCM08_12195 [Microscillaceae bacterium]|nr:hypothetical protein [Microscillaceae bacterium]
MHFKPSFCKSLIVLLLLLGQSHLCQAQFKEYYLQLIFSAKQKDYQRAIDYAELSMPMAGDTLGLESQEFGIYLSNVAKIYQAAGQYDRATLYYQQAIEVRRRFLKTNPEDLAKTMAAYASSFQAQGNYLTAEAQYKEAIEVLVQQQLTNSLLFIAINQNIAKLYLLMGKVAEAENLSLQNLAQVTGLGSENGPLAWSITYQLGLIYQDTQRTTEASAIYQDLLKAYRDSQATENYEYVQLLCSAAVLHYTQRRFDESKQAAQEALAVLNRISGSDEDLAYAQVVHSLAILNEKQANYPEAEKLYKKALGIRSRELGADHLDYAQSLSDFAGYCVQTKKFTAADTLYQKALGIRQKKLGEKNYLYARTLSDMSTLYYQSRNFEKARQLGTKALEIQQQSLPEKHPDIANTLFNMANIYLAENNYTAAEPLYKQVLAYRAETGNTNNPNYFAVVNALGELYQKQNNVKEAEARFVEALNLWGNLVSKTDPGYLRTLHNLADLYLQAGNLDAAEPYYQQIKEVYESQPNNDQQEYARTLISLASIAYERSRIVESQTLYEKALQVFKAFYGDNDPSYVYALNDLAGIYKNTARYAEAEQLYSQAEKLGKIAFGENAAEYATTLNNFAALYVSMGRFNEAEAYYRLVLDIREKALGLTHPDYAVTLSDLGVLYEAQGKFAAAEQLMQQSLNIRKQGNAQEDSEYAYMLARLANLYKAMGRYEEAEANYVSAREIFKKTVGVKHPEYANTLNALALLYKKLNRNDEVEPLYQEALEIRRSTLGEGHPTYANSLDNLASFYSSQRRFSEAESLYQQALDIRRQVLGETHPGFAASLNNLAILYENEGQDAKAEPLYEQTIDIFKNTLGVSHPNYAATLNNLASLYNKLQRFDKAELLYKDAVNIVLEQIEQNFASLSEEEKRQFYEANRQFFNNFMLYVANVASQSEVVGGLSLDILGDAYNLLLATKGLLLSSTSKIRRRIAQSGNQVLIEKFQQWQEQRDLIAKLYNVGEIELRKKGYDLKVLVQQANQLEKELTTLSKDFGSTYQSGSTHWLDIKSKLQPDEAAVEIIRVQQSQDTVIYVALIISNETTTHPDFVVFTNGAELEKRYLNYYKNIIRSQREDEYSYEKFWQPLQGKLKSYKRIYFSPDGVFTQININTLRMPNSNDYLVDLFDIVLLTNTKELLDPVASADDQPKAVLLGNPSFAIQVKAQTALSVDLSDQQDSWIKSAVFQPLPGTGVEVNEIDKLLSKEQWDTQLYLEKLATEEVIKRLQSPTILHIATHGFFIPMQELELAMKANLGEAASNEKKINPMLLSGLVLAGVTDYFAQNERTKDLTREDGILTAYEAMDLNLDNTEMVVLSACETGLGKVQSGEGVYGLQRALRIAGARLILMSLWKVDDAATQELMNLFYEEWLKNKDKRAAFKAAQKKLRAKYNHPYYWGAFVLNGI